MQSVFSFMEVGKENEFEFDAIFLFTLYMCYPGTQFTCAGY